jgi:hypothetical protein
VPRGQGYILLSQLRIDEYVSDVAVTVNRLRSLLLTNLGGTLQGAGTSALARKRRLEQYQYTPIDLGPWANRGLTDNKDLGIVGWANQGENDMRELPTGRLVADGIPFQIAAPKAVIALYSPMANNTDLPKEVKGIKLGQKADALFFLHTTAWGVNEPIQYVVHYEDGTRAVIHILQNQQLFGWWEDPNTLDDAMARHGAFVAWKGSNPMVKAMGRWGIMLPGWEWPNPHPDKAIRELDFVAPPEGGYGCIPLLVAITAARTQTDTGLVTDVLGTAGVKVKLGTQEQDIYYIGSAGIEPKHPFHAQAVAAHRALVVGKKVRVVYDVVRQNSSGQALAYVYLPDENDDLANAKIIGDGLGALGNFEGNNTQRMYFENLGFIAKQSKKGMWAAEAAK